MPSRVADCSSCRAPSSERSTHDSRPDGAGWFRSHTSDHPPAAVGRARTARPRERGRERQSSCACLVLSPKRRPSVARGGSGGYGGNGQQRRHGATEDLTLNDSVSRCLRCLPFPPSPPLALNSRGFWQRVSRLVVGRRVRLWRFGSPLCVKVFAAVAFEPLEGAV